MRRFSSHPPTHTPLEASRAPEKNTSALGALFSLRDFRLWYSGQILSLTGTWMQITAQGYFLYELTRSREYLGYLGFLSGAPNLFLMLWGGVLADRLPRRFILLCTQSAMMILSLLLTLLVFTGTVKPWHILAVALGMGIANALDVPARQAFLIEIIDRRYLTEAVALNSSLFQGAMALGPLLGGFVYAHFGPGYCFLANTLSFLAILGALFAMEGGNGRPAQTPTSPLTEILSALTFVRGTREILFTLILIASVSTLGMSFVSLLPAWAKEILHGDARTLGTLHFFRALGALTGVLCIALLSSRVPRATMMGASLLLYPLFLWLFALGSHPLLSYLFLLGAGTFMVSTINLSNSFVQLKVPDTLRGRVMSLFSLTFFGGVPLGSLLFGWIAEGVGLRASMIVAAICTTTLALLFYSPLQRIQGGSARQDPSLTLPSSPLA